VDFHRGKANSADSAPALAKQPTDETESTQTPEERLESSFQDIHTSLANEVLDTVKKSPEPPIFTSGDGGNEMNHLGLVI
jgi:hypothetical protein